MSRESDKERTYECEECPLTFTVYDNYSSCSLQCPLCGGEVKSV